MKFIDAFPTGASINAPAAFLLGCFVACGVTTARAADVCLTFPQARAAFPGKHLYWHGRNRCWDDRGRFQATEVKHRLTQTKPVPVPRQTVLWPALSLTRATPVDAALLTPEPATRWPLLIDVDELTGGPVANCCWPPFDEPPFRERWTAIPVNWLRP